MSSAHHWTLLQQSVLVTHLSESVRVFQANGISTLAFKGFVAARNYPPDNPRLFSDNDIAVTSRDYPAALELLGSGVLDGLGVDLHNEFRALDTCSFDSVYARSHTIDIEGVEVRVPCPEDHLRLLCVHWLTDGGEYRERLWDIYYAVQNRPPDFDWDLCLNSVSELRRKWIVVTVGIANRYLQLPIDDLPFADEARDIPDWIINTLEREWASDLRLRPLREVYREPKALLQQIKKRLPPNPIQATVNVEGRFDASPRFGYHVASIAKRTPAALRRFGRLLFRGKIE